MWSTLDIAYDPMRQIQTDVCIKWISKCKFRRTPIGQYPTSKILYTVSKANLDLGKNMLLLENSQFLPNHNETLP